MKLLLTAILFVGLSAQAEELFRVTCTNTECKSLMVGLPSKVTHVTTNVISVPEMTTSDRREGRAARDGLDTTPAVNAKETTETMVFRCVTCGKDFTATRITRRADAVIDLAPAKEEEKPIEEPPIEEPK